METNTASIIHSRRQERVGRDPIRASTKDTNVVYFEEPSESGLVNQLFLHDAHAAKPNLLNFGIQYVALLPPPCTLVNTWHLSLILGRTPSSTFTWTTYKGCSPYPTGYHNLMSPDLNWNETCVTPPFIVILRRPVTSLPEGSLSSTSAAQGVSEESRIRTVKSASRCSLTLADA